MDRGELEMAPEAGRSASAGTLYVVATPIGNPEDLSPRAERTLRDVDLIAAEDTRTTGRLLARLGFGKPLLSFHDHNEAQRTAGILRRLGDGMNVALVSEAGTPLVSDPGFRLVRAAAAAGFRIATVPGPSAAIAALSIAGLPTDRFLVLGFLPRRAGRRRAALEELRRETATQVFFEAPHRILAALADLQEILGNRRAVLARNLTKEHETVLRGTLSELHAALAGLDFVAGEITLVVAGADAPDGDAWPEAAERAVERLLAEGLAPSRVQAIVTHVFALDRRQVYRRILQAARDGGD
jgi:16S rRNA (cytidine1402-2'-O)-methyltransferase